MHNVALTRLRQGNRKNMWEVELHCIPQLNHLLDPRSIRWPCVALCQSCYAPAKMDKDAPKRNAVSECFQRNVLKIAAIWKLCAQKSNLACSRSKLRRLRHLDVSVFATQQLSHSSSYHGEIMKISEPPEALSFQAIALRRSSLPGR